MDRTEITTWALANGWQVIAGHPSLTKPGRPKDAIVRIVYLATVASLEVKKPAGKWEKIASTVYSKIHADVEGGWPLGLGFEKIPSLSMLMRDNKDAQVFAKLR
jgi:hypothetical protein